MAAEEGILSEDVSEKHREHRVQMTDREKVSISGVLHVDAFDEREISLETELGMLTLRGQDLHIESLDLETGEFTCGGLITGLQYTAGTRSRTGAARGLLERIFH